MTQGKEPGADGKLTLSRRALVSGAGLGGAVLVGAGWLAGHSRSGHADPVAPADMGMLMAMPMPASGPYGGMFDPPDALDAKALDAITLPPPPDDLPPGSLREITFDVVERPIEVSKGVMVDAWSYNGQVPGPTLRAKEGDLLRITLNNRTQHAHNLHFHGQHSPQMDGWEPIPPGESTVYEISAGPFGLHPYHCHVMPIAMHISRGMHGVLIVDPPTPRPPAHEVVLILCGWDPAQVGKSEVVTWNGIASYFSKFPIKVTAGELVRLYVVNMLEYEPIGSFHLHARTFDVFPTGTSLIPSAHTDVITLGMAERAVLEFTLPERGRYMFHPHQHWLAEHGAMGWFAAI
ncbi:MAG: multicopper oxidase domain-containing protein [Caldilineaceae bacterium]|nr:multicopper oxidase domain-containing protein [Caldilineaceae bacterium]MBP8125546.1 multicopper oxidase domain-containing protein [Caldilineaceae bacterium]MBP9071851.1 multicopper oxidase domain-containing protein [Caldilineaceae bacterium]